MLHYIKQPVKILLCISLSGIILLLNSCAEKTKTAALKQIDRSSVLVTEDTFHLGLAIMGEQTDYTPIGPAEGNSILYEVISQGEFKKDNFDISRIIDAEYKTVSHWISSDVEIGDKILEISNLRAYSTGTYYYVIYGVPTIPTTDGDDEAIPLVKDYTTIYSSYDSKATWCYRVLNCDDYSKIYIEFVSQNKYKHITPLCSN